jgi:hypothetical protein
MFLETGKEKEKGMVFITKKDEGMLISIFRHFLWRAYRISETQTPVWHPC